MRNIGDFIAILIFVVVCGLFVFLLVHLRFLFFRDIIRSANKEKVKYSCENCYYKQLYDDQKPENAVKLSPEEINYIRKDG